MAVYRPKRNGTASKFYVCEFVVHRKRIQESTGSTSRTVAKEYEKRRRAELERAAAGLPTERKAPQLRTVAEIADSYLDAYKLNHRPKSIVFAGGCLRQVKRLLGTFLVSDLTDDRVRFYIRGRQGDRASGRTINMELGELSRAMGSTWRELWPKLRKLEERKDIGRALSPEEQDRLLNGLETTQSPILRTLIPVLLLTGIRSGEAMTLSWGQLDLLGRTITVGRAKTACGTGRVIPINDDLAHSIALHRAWFFDRFGEPDADHYFFPWGSSEPSDPGRHATTVKRSWGELRIRTGVSCRLHDLRHTFATGLAERGVPESTMLALMGHMSRAMLERYSHIRMAAKPEAVAGATLRPKGGISEVLPVKVPVLRPPAQLQ
jgi:integrase